MQDSPTPIVQGRRRGMLITSEVKVPTLLQPFPICKRIAEGEAAIFGKTEDLDRLVVAELRHTLFPKIVLDVPQVPCREVGADLRQLSVLSRQCLERRIPDAERLAREIGAWEQER